MDQQPRVMKPFRSRLECPLFHVSRQPLVGTESRPHRGRPGRVGATLRVQHSQDVLPYRLPILGRGVPSGDEAAQFRGRDHEIAARYLEKDRERLLGQAVDRGVEACYTRHNEQGIRRGNRNEPAVMCHQYAEPGQPLAEIIGRDDDPLPDGALRRSDLKPGNRVGVLDEQPQALLGRAVEER